MLVAKCEKFVTFFLLPKYCRRVTRILNELHPLPSVRQAFGSSAVGNVGES